MTVVDSWILELYPSGLILSVSMYTYIYVYEYCNMYSAKLVCVVFRESKENWISNICWNLKNNMYIKWNNSDTWTHTISKI